VPEHPEFSAIRDEHRDLLSAMEDIETLANTRPTASGVKEWVTSLRQEVQGLSAELEGHFRREEEGFFRILDDEHPELGRELESLRGQHGEILGIFKTIENQARGPADENLGAEVRRQLLGLLDLLRYHEERENELLQDASSLDLGDSD
jgi:hypothetical protein